MNCMIFVEASTTAKEKHTFTPKIILIIFNEISYQLETILEQKQIQKKIIEEFYLRIVKINLLQSNIDRQKGKIL